MNKTFENCTLLDTFTWFEKAFPQPVAKNFTTQLGVHLEEVAEMLETLEGTDGHTRSMLANAILRLQDLGDYLKAQEGSIEVANEVELLDALCDQIVTATGVAYMRGQDIIGAMTEVNASNFSKFDDKGNPIYNANLKLMKGPRYFKPVLTPFLPK